jgi:hypothetical protein
MKASFHILSNSLLTTHPITNIQHYVIQQMNKHRYKTAVNKSDFNVVSRKCNSAPIRSLSSYVSFSSRSSITEEQLMGRLCLSVRLPIRSSKLPLLKPIVMPVVWYTLAAITDEHIAYSISKIKFMYKR